MNINKIQHQKKLRRLRVRSKIKNHTLPRLTVFRSNQHIYAQVIDDAKALTLASASDLEVKISGTKTEKAGQVGELIAKKAKAKKVTKVSFDRGEYKYAGRIKKLAESARENGLEF